MALHEFNYEKEATVSIVKSILTDAIKMKASDIHFDPEPNKLVIRFRINGDLIEYTTSPESVKTNILTRIKILSGMNITEATIPQIGSINFELSSKTHNMRTASIPVIDGEKIVVHLSNYAKNFKSLNSLGFEKENINKIMDMLNNQDGIILITGVNSSGKTTSMYAILQELSKKPLNIISVENPIKMKLTGINQVQINNEKGITYNNILKSILMSDPDVIAINELIDDETVRTALRSSIAGSLVISTMNTKTAFTTIKSLQNMDVENYLLGSNLNGIISQRLVKKLCPTCREKKIASDYEKRIIKAVLDTDIEELYVPTGCEECQDGYVDQIPVAEVVCVNDELRQAISNHRNEDLIYNIIYSENDSIIKDVFKKVLNGDTSFEEAIKIIDIKTDLSEDEKDLKNLLLGKIPEDDYETPEENNNSQPQENNNEEENKVNETKEESSEDKPNDEEQPPKDEKNEEPKEDNEEEKENEQPKDENKANESILNDNELLQKALKIIENQLKDQQTKDDEKKNDEQAETKDVDSSTKADEDKKEEKENKEEKTEDKDDSSKDEQTEENTETDSKDSEEEPKAENEKDDDSPEDESTSDEDKVEDDDEDKAEESEDNETDNESTDDDITEDATESEPSVDDITDDDNQDDGISDDEVKEDTNSEEKDEDEENEAKEPELSIQINPTPAPTKTSNNDAPTETPASNNPIVIPKDDDTDDDDDDSFNYDSSYVNNF